MTLFYKAFDKDLRCRGFQYEIGKSYELQGQLKLCQNGFHACETIEQAFRYYPKESSRACEVRFEGLIVRDNDKAASDKITIIRELSKDEIETEMRRLPKHRTLEDLVATLADYFWTESSWDHFRAELLANGDKEYETAHQNNAYALAQFMKACAENWPEFKALLKVD